MEVINTAESQINYKFEKRIQLAKYLLLTTRFSLFSDKALPKVLFESSAFCRDQDCAAILKKLLKIKQFYRNKSITNRHCGHETFSFILSGHKTIINKTDKTILYTEDKKTAAYLIDGKELQVAKQLGVMKAQHKWPAAVYCKGLIFVLSEKFKINNNFMTVEKYCFSDEAQKCVADKADRRANFCALMDQTFMLGGEFQNPHQFYETATCLKLDTKSFKWSQVAGMSVERAACTEFEESVVVSDGCNRDKITNIVETYDVTGTWSPMTKMTEARCEHGLLLVKNKLFAIGGDSHVNYPYTTREVYDSCLKKSCQNFKPPQKC